MLYMEHDIDPFNPPKEIFTLGFVASALSKKCRFNGCCSFFYSVAQHCILVARLILRDPTHNKELYPKLALEGLHHEGDEVLLPDIPRPIKPFIPGWKEISEQHHKTYLSAFNLPYPQSKLIKYYDDMALHTEQKFLMPDSKDWSYLPPIAPWAKVEERPIKEVEEEFIKLHIELSK